MEVITMKACKRIEALPTYVFGAVDQLKSKYLQQGIELFDFSMGNPDGATPESIVNSLLSAIKNPQTHRYVKPAKGLDALRTSIASWYQRNYQVSINPDNEAVITIGAKEGISHLALAMIDPGDSVLVPTPTYPIHQYAFLIAGAKVDTFSVQSEEKMLAEIKSKLQTNSSLKALMLNFPANPTGECVSLAFFEEVVALAKRYQVWVIHDFAYADVSFDGIRPPSILQVNGAKECSVEVCSLSKSYNMPGWRIGYVAGNPTLVNALIKIKSYYDYGLFAPIQIAAIEALQNCDQQKKEICDNYQTRRDVLCDALNGIGWQVKKPNATMFVWAKIPDAFSHLDSVTFTKLLIEHTHVVVSPGIGFGKAGDDSVRFALIENEQRIVQAISNIKPLLSNPNKFNPKEQQFGTG